MSLDDRHWTTNYIYWTLSGADLVQFKQYKIQIEQLRRIHHSVGRDTFVNVGGKTIHKSFSAFYDAGKWINYNRMRQIRLDAV